MNGRRRLRDSFDSAQLLMDQQIGRRSQAEIDASITNAGKGAGGGGLAVFAGLHRVGRLIRQLAFTGNLVSVNASGDRVVIDLTGAPADASYVLQTALEALPNAQALGALSTGILKSTTATGVLSIASGADLPSHTHAQSDVTDLTTDLANKVPLATGTPTVAAQTAAGTTASVSIAGSDRIGLVSVTPGGTGIAAGTQLRVSFGVARSSSNFAVKLQRADQTAADVSERAIGRTTARWDLYVPGALVSGTTYSWFYIVEQYA